MNEILNLYKNGSSRIKRFFYLWIFLICFEVLDIFYILFLGMHKYILLAPIFGLLVCVSGINGWKKSAKLEKEIEEKHKELFFKILATQIRLNESNSDKS
jgi:hypothetical protein